MNHAMFQGNLSIRQKLRNIIMSTVCAALILACAAVLGSNLAALLSSMRNDLGVLAEIFGSNSTAALAFGDQKAAEEVLSALKAKGHIVGACIYSPDGKPFATYRRAPESREFTVPPLGSDGSRLEGGRVTVFRRISLRRKIIGAICLESDLGEILSRFRDSAAIVLVILLAALLLALGLSSRLQRIITEPIANIAETARTVSLGKNYAARAVKTTDDELGQLTVTFNEMLSEIERRDAELMEHRDRLEQEIAARTVELVESRDKAEAASRAKSAFLANMSHEIRTPMNAILGYSQLMMRDPAPSADVKKNLKIINRSGEHLLALINDVLDMSKIEAGGMRVHPVEFDLGSLLEDLAGMFRLRAAGKNLKFDVLVDGEGPRRLVADEGKLRQALINLLGNAIKFTERGRIQLRVSVERRDGGGLWLSCAVEDTGVGIAQKEMGTLFLPFVQTQSGINFQAGTGLGLAISSEFIRLMGGRITVTSEPGKGSAFRFAVPVEPGDPAAATREALHRTVIGLPAGKPAPRVLIVDDERNNRDWLNQLLAALGFAVREAENGIAALRTWEAWRPQLILMDVRMPLMDGMEATRRIREDPRGGKTVIIALTASAMEEDRLAIMQCGADDFLSKPCRQRELLAKIQTHLDLAYRYEGDETPANTDPLDAEPVGPPEQLPAELAGALREAVRDGDKYRLDELIREVAEQSARSARALQELADNYEYDALTSLLETNR